MKFILGVTLLGALLASLVSNNDTLGDRIAGNIISMREAQIQRAYAVSGIETGTISTVSVGTQIRFLSENLPENCKAGKEYLQSASLSYKQNMVDHSVNETISRNVNWLCS